MWRVMTQEQELIELSFMLVGHTKFSPDRFFGLFKKAYCRSSISTDAHKAKFTSVRDHGGRQVFFYKWTVSIFIQYPTFSRTTSLGSRLLILELCTSANIVIQKKKFSTF